MKLNDIQYYTGCLLQSGMTDPELVFKIACIFYEYYDTKVKPNLRKSSHGTHDNHGNHVNHGTIETHAMERGVLKGGKPNKKSLSSIDAKFLKQMQIRFPHLDVAIEFESFRDYLSSKGKTYKDYRAAFRNWLKSPYQQKAEQPVDETKRKIANEKDEFDRKWEKNQKRAASVEDIRSILGKTFS